MPTKVMIGDGDDEKSRATAPVYRTDTVRIGMESEDKRSRLVTYEYGEPDAACVSCRIIEKKKGGKEEEQAISTDVRVSACISHAKMPL